MCRGQVTPLGDGGNEAVRQFGVALLQPLEGGLPFFQGCPEFIRIHLFPTGRGAQFAFVSALRRGQFRGVGCRQLIKSGLHVAGATEPRRVACRYPKRCPKGLERAGQFRCQEHVLQSLARLAVVVRQSVSLG